MRYTRLKVRRKMRSRKRQVMDIGLTASKQLDRHIFRRWHNFKSAQRFIAGWLSLVVILIVAVIVQTIKLGNTYLVATPVAGGVYSEGVVGQFTNANPIFATNGVDLAVSKLVFGSLLKYDEYNKLVNDLALSWSVDEKGTTYTFHLRRNILWHDGKPLNSDDVVFTYKTINNPDSKSPFASSFSGVVIEKVDEYTVRFVLPTAYSPFPHSLVIGIVPYHLLKTTPAEQLRSLAFNTKTPVGSGPFVWKDVVVSGDNQQQQSDTIQLLANEHYYSGKPKLEGITIKTYSDDSQLLKALTNKQVITAAGLDIADSEVPNGYETHSFNLMSANMLFLKNSSPILSDLRVRQALIKATDISLLLSKIGYPAITVQQPLLKTQIGYNPSIKQLGYDKQAAATQLDNAGWVINKGDTYRTKDGRQLVINLAYENKRDFSRLASELQRQWADIGVNLEIDVTRDENDSLKYIDNHEYDVLLYGISIGADPDVYVYWHSSQISKTSQTRLNLAEYKSTKADMALEAGRSRIDADLRAAKYKPFLEAWREDVPAIGLYQPRYLYVSAQHIYGLDNTKLINVPSDRFNNIEKWMINTVRSTVE